LNAIWLMNGHAIQQDALAGYQVGNEWSIAGLGDFNGDGRDDILWRNDNGMADLWTMNGHSIQQDSLVGYQVGNDWLLT
jgi:hypothetical protein